MPSPSRLRREDGFSLVELLAACLLLLVGILGAVASLDTSRDVTSTAEVRETAAHHAERELERVRALPYSSLGLTTATGARKDWADASAAQAETFVTGGVVQPVRSLQGGRLSATLHVAITTYDDPHVAGAVTARRVVVAVVPTGAWKLPRPIVASTVVAGPPS